MSLNHRRRLPIISLLLLVLMVRALVPVGFMPASDGSAQLTLCPDGMLMPDNSGKAADPGPSRVHTDHCPFGSAPFAAPIAQLPGTAVPVAAISRSGFEFSPWVPNDRVGRAHQPRAPPA